MRRHITGTASNKPITRPRKKSESKPRQKLRGSVYMTGAVRLRKILTLLVRLLEKRPFLAGQDVGICHVVPCTDYVTNDVIHTNRPRSHHGLRQRRSQNHKSCHVCTISVVFSDAGRAPSIGLWNVNAILDIVMFRQWSTPIGPESCYGLCG